MYEDDKYKVTIDDVKAGDIIYAVEVPLNLSLIHNSEPTRPY